MPLWLSGRSLLQSSPQCGLGRSVARGRITAAKGVLASTLLNAKMRNGTLWSRGLNGQDTNRGSVPFGTGSMYVYTANQGKALTPLTAGRDWICISFRFSAVCFMLICFMYTVVSQNWRKPFCFCSKFRNDTVSIRFFLNAHVACTLHLCLEHDQKCSGCIFILF